MSNSVAHVFYVPTNKSLNPGWYWSSAAPVLTDGLAGPYRTYGEALSDIIRAGLVPAPVTQLGAMK